MALDYALLEAGDACTFLTFPVIEMHNVLRYCVNGSVYPLRHDLFYCQQFFAL